MSTPAGRNRAIGIATAASVAAVGTLTWMTGAHAATNYTFDTGSGVVFTISGTNGNMTSLKHNGVELAASGKAAGQFQSGWSSATVTAKTFDSGNSQLVSAVHGNVTQYYFARKGDNNIYLDTGITGAIDPGEARFIARLKKSLVPTSPVAARTGDTTGTVEGSDVFSFANGQTASKFYSSQRLIEQQPFGAHGTAHGVYILPGTHEMSSGGPFFRDIEVNDTGTVTNITHYMFSGHTQTETMRLGLQAPYAMAITSGATPTAVNLDFLSAYLPGLPSVAERGTVTGTATGSWGGLSGTVALSGPAGQYWAAVSGGKFGIGKVRPGAYTATLYAGELAVGETKSVTVTAGGTSTLALSGTSPTPGTLFQIGAFDGTPKGFLNADKIETMHPSDTRMSSWNVSSFTAGSAATGFPMALFKSANSPLTVNFDLASVPAGGAKLRIATTLAFAGGRPSVTVGGWNSPASASPAPKNLDSRGVTRGTWRGINTTYTFTIPASALKAGTNNLVISTISGSSGTTFLSPNFVFDALALNPA